MSIAPPGGSGMVSDGTHTKRSGLLLRHRKNGGDLETDQLQHQPNYDGNRYSRCTTMLARADKNGSTRNQDQAVPTTSSAQSDTHVTYFLT